ncbi:MAG TPA: hypothetical protein VGT98_06235 [Candidatus Elarobacter sp.]|nr:hypothetical protein [Candidatus Elarobacter sp.]HEV2738675.1 hypothetical protein [Candidatus Elarobacter sp.]
MYDDNGEPKRPNWRVNEVYTLLYGVPVKRDDMRHVENKDGVIEFFQSATFECGCTVSDDGGWTSCGQGLHAALAAVSYNSRLAQEFREARAAFDAVLAEAWVRRGGPPEAYIEFQAARQREFTPFERWKTAHDLLGKSIWKNGYLQAELRDVPLVEDIRLSGGKGERELRLEWRHERGDAFRLPFAPDDAVRMVFDKK